MLILNLFSSPPLHQFFVQCKDNNQQAKVSMLNSGKFLFCLHIHCTENFGHLLVITCRWVHWQYTCLCCIGSMQQYQFFIHLLWPGTRSIKLLEPIQPFNKPYHVKRYESQLIPKAFSVVNGYSFQKQVPCIVWSYGKLVKEHQVTYGATVSWRLSFGPRCWAFYLLSIFFALNQLYTVCCLCCHHNRTLAVCCICSSLKHF